MAIDSYVYVYICMYMCIHICEVCEQQFITVFYNISKNKLVKYFMKSGYSQQAQHYLALDRYVCMYDMYVCTQHGIVGGYVDSRNTQGSGYISIDKYMYECVLYI